MNLNEIEYIQVFLCLSVLDFTDLRFDGDDVVKDFGFDRVV